MVSVFGCQVFAVLIIVAYTRADEDNQHGSVSSQSSVSIAKPDEGQGSWQAGTYNGYYPSRLAFNTNLSYRPSDSLHNLYTYTSYLQQYIAQLQKIIQQQIEAQKHAAASGAPGGGAPNSVGVHGAVAGGYVGPDGGGYGGAGLLPYPTNAQGGAIPPSYVPAGRPSYHGVFSSASSSSSTVNGEHKEEHASTFGVDNNGHVTVYSAHHP